MLSSHTGRHHYGIAAVAAMACLVIIGTLATAVATLSQKHVRTSYNNNFAVQARSNAESGLRWMAWKFQKVKMPTTTLGVIDHEAAKKLWPEIMQNLMTDLASMKKDSLKAAPSIAGDTIHIGPVIAGNGVEFEIIAGPSPDYVDRAQVIQVKSIGRYRDITRAMTMNFLIQKSMRYSIISKVPVQLGKNTSVEGDVYVAAAPTKANRDHPPIFSISDFRYTKLTTNDSLTTKVAAFQKFLGSSKNGKPVYLGGNNRIPVADAALVAAMRSSSTQLANVTDVTQDGFIDEYDIFLMHMDRNANGEVTADEFMLSASEDPNLLYLIDRSLGRPFTANEKPRTGLGDSLLNWNDPYAKVRGIVKIWETRDELAARIKERNIGGSIAEIMQGPIVSPDGYTNAVQFGENNPDDPAVRLSANDFNMSAFLDLAGPNAGSQKRPSTIKPDTLVTFANTIIKRGDANYTADSTLISKLTSASNVQVVAADKDNKGKITKLKTIKEPIPYGSSNPQAYVERPVFSNINFRNCIIERGTNALFVNCTFDGVTFVDGSSNLKSGDYNNGNSLRFESCTFTGPIAQGDINGGSNRGKAPPTFTHNNNKWEFTGDTVFDSDKPSLDGTTDTPALKEIKQQATIMAPQTSIDIGSFTNPGEARLRLRGVVVAGCIDIRGVAEVDGSIIALDTRDAADTVTLGYFGSDDSKTSAGGPGSEAGFRYGRIHIRYNPYRTLPDGINFAVSIMPDVSTWREVMP